MPGLEMLTPGEREVIRLVAAGRTNRDSSPLDLAHTVRRHLENIFEKLEDERAAAVADSRSSSRNLARSISSASPAEATPTYIQPSYRTSDYVGPHAHPAGVAARRRSDGRPIVTRARTCQCQALATSWRSPFSRPWQPWLQSGLPRTRPRRPDLGSRGRRRRAYLRERAPLRGGAPAREPCGVNRRRPGHTRLDCASAHASEHCRSVRRSDGSSVRWLALRAASRSRLCEKFRRHIRRHRRGRVTATTQRVAEGAAPLCTRPTDFAK